MQHEYVLGTKPVLSEINFNRFNRSFPFLGQLRLLVMTESNTGFSEGQMIDLHFGRSQYLFFP